MTEQSTDTIKVQLGEPMSCVGAPCRSMGEVLFTEVTHIFITKGLKSWAPGAHCIACRQLNRLKDIPF